MAFFWVVFTVITLIRVLNIESSRQTLGLQLVFIESISYSKLITLHPINQPSQSISSQLSINLISTSRSSKCILLLPIDSIIVINFPSLHLYNRQYDDQYIQHQLLNAYDVELGPPSPPDQPYHVHHDEWNHGKNAVDH